MRSRMYGLLAAGTVCLLASTSALALDPGPKCEASKLDTLAKYAQCRLKADAKAVKKATTADYSKCNLDKFTKAEDAGGMDCPTTTDQTTVSDYLDDCTMRAAQWLAGDGGLPVTCELPGTGQTTDYGPGSDGELQRGVARSFTVNNDGTITDNVTGLMWEKKSDDGSIHDADNTYTWSTGTNNMDGTMVSTFLEVLNNRCDQDTTAPCTVDADCTGGACGFAGYRDWRIPNRNELLSITNMEAVDPATYTEFNNGCTDGCTVTQCSCTPQGGIVWLTSTTVHNNPTRAWYVDFFEAYVDYKLKTGSSYVRAVRDGS